VNKTQKTVLLSSVLILALSLSVGFLLVSAGTEETEATETQFQRLRHHNGTIPMLRDKQAMELNGTILTYGYRQRMKLEDPFSMLSDELRAELDEAIQALREENATHQEISEYISNFLEENGVEWQPPATRAQTILD
jgi:hypothetical protein